ncbi:MAG: NAD(P)-binding protein, partial [bacterium]
RTTEELRESESLRDHVIIAGYGLTGRNLAHSLTQIGTRYIIVDLNTENVRDAARQGEPACFGDVTSAEVLEHLGAAEASELVIAINDPDATVRAIGAARHSAPDLRITVRTAYDADVKRLEEAGATRVVAAEAAAADAIIDLVLGNIGDSPEEQSGPTCT